MVDLGSVRRWVEPLARPEYTGENRCWPCTALNLGLVLAAGLAAGRRRRPLGLLVLAAGCALVALRGYVVPGTPRFGPRLVASLPFDVAHGTDADGPSGSLAIDDDADDASGPLAAATDPEALLEALAAAGVLAVDEDALRLDDAFRGAWEDRMASLRERPRSELAERAARAASGDVDGEFHRDRVLLAGDRDVWLRPAVAIAETAAVETLADWDVPADVRAPAAQPLRTFVGTCPACGGDVVETTLRNCCGGPGGIHRNPERPVLACEACDAVVVQFDDAGPETDGPI